jgi:AraC-like DNA-binding protein
MAARLADAVFIEAARTHFSEARGDSSAWAAAVGDPAISFALTLLHREPARAWTVAILAAEVGMSRSAFSPRFQQLVGDTPMKYLARRRIAKAKRLLRASAASIADIAHQVGYESEAAFSRSFRRHAGVPPAAFRARRDEREG